MKSTIIKEENQVYATVEGRLDVINSNEFEKQISELFMLKEANIIIDCDKLVYISSSGLRVFLALQKAVNANQGKLVLKNLAANIKEVFKITGFVNLFVIE